MIVDGVLFKERKDQTKTLNDEGVEESLLIHTRVIGERSYTAKQFIIEFDGEEDEEMIEMIETDMTDSELENFKNEWEKKLGILTRFFQFFLD